MFPYSNSQLPLHSGFDFAPTWGTTGYTPSHWPTSTYTPNISSFGYSNNYSHGFDSTYSPYHTPALPPSNYPHSSHYSAPTYSSTDWNHTSTHSRGQSPTRHLGYRAHHPPNMWEAEDYHYPSNDLEHEYDDSEQNWLDNYEPVNRPEHRSSSRSSTPNRDRERVLGDNGEYYVYDPNAKPVRSALRRSPSQERKTSSHNSLSLSEDPVPCFVCGRPVGDEGVKAEDRAFHSEHFTCHTCKRQLGPHLEFYRHGDVYYCANDFKRDAAFRCVYCNKDIRGQRLNNFYGEGVCRSHRRDSQATDCQDCGRIVPINSPYRARIKRLQCDVCQRSSVRSEDQARKLFATVRYTLDQEYNIGIRSINVPLCFMTMEEIRRETVGTGHAKMPKVVGGLTKCDYNGIYNVKWIGVPKFVSNDRLAMIMAHELAHAYMFVNHFPLRSLGLAIEEGICELVSYMWMTSQRQKHKQVYQFWIDQMMRGSDKIYHEGFRTVKRSFDKFAARRDPSHALQEFLNYIKMNKALPQ